MPETKPLSKYRQTLKEKILQTAMTLFATHGIKAVKMDDISKNLGISKRTLYEIYENKEVLLFEGVKKYTRQKEQEMLRLSAESHNVMDIILSSYKIRVEEFKLTSPQFYSDLYIYPQVMAFLDDDRKTGQERFLKFMSRGVKEGYFRKDIDYQFVMMTFDAIMQYIMSRELYKQYTLEQIFRNILFVTLRGFCTPKGIASLDSFLDKD